MPSFESGFESCAALASSKPLHLLVVAPVPRAAMYRIPRRRCAKEWCAASDILLRFNKFPLETKVLQFLSQPDCRFFRGVFRNLSRNPEAADCVSMSEYSFHSGKSRV